MGHIINSTEEQDVVSGSSYSINTASMVATVSIDNEQVLLHGAIVSVIIAHEQVLNGVVSVSIAHEQALLHGAIVSVVVIAQDDQQTAQRLAVGHILNNTSD